MENTTASGEAGIVSAGPSTLERRISLSQQLQNRPNEQDLKNRHILLDTNAAPSLQAQQHELERQRITDSLKKNLDHRPAREELVDRNILPDTTSAPALQGPRRELYKHMRADSLEKRLQQRPSPAELVKEGILPENSLEEDQVPGGSKSGEQA